MVSGVVLYAMSSYAEKVSSLSLGSITALTGTIGKPIGAVQLPPVAALGATPLMLISAADVHCPRWPASLSALSLTNRADRGGKIAYFAEALSAHLPDTTG